MLRTVSGVGTPDEAETDYTYNNRNQPTNILNPIEEPFTYEYNDMEMVKEKKVPGSGLYRYWYDEKFRLAASKDANGTTLVYKYDDYNRITYIYAHTNNITFDSDEDEDEENDGTVTSSEMTQFFQSSKRVQTITYTTDNDTDFRTWSIGSTEKVLTEDGNGLYKSTTLDRDDFGRIESSVSTYPAYGGMGVSTLTNTNTWNDAGLVTMMRQITAGPQTIDLSYAYVYDNFLRPTDTWLNMQADIPNSEGTLISHLEYNSKDLVKTKYLGESAPGEGFLQKVDYLYDAAGKLTHINTPGESECTQGDDICTLRSTFKFDIETADPECPGYLSAIEIGTHTLVVYPVMPLANTSSAETLRNRIISALDQLGYSGEVTVTTEIEYGVLVSYTVTVENTDAPGLLLKNQDCDFGEFEPVDCCTISPPLGGAGTDNPIFALNPDLFSEELTFTGLDITRIEYGSDCTIGRMRNDFTYDALHRVKTLTNTLFNPDAITGRYDETFIYDPAGNIKYLTRNGHTGNGVYEQIDDLAYTYSGEHLTNVTDNTISNTARPFGFRPDASGYTYDDNGNLKKDTGKKLNIRSNVLNLPQKVWNMLDETDYLKIDYTFAGENIRKREYENGTIKEDRFYLGGVEFVNSIAETYSHPEGRIQIVQTPGEPFKYAFQYKISDHLGNMAVFFEDSDSDGIIATEDSDPANSEVLQRHFYYSFGMEMQGAWVPPSAPENQYQYNGKELNENLGLDWYDYGARWYDAAVGRFNGVDPIADQYVFVSVYNYAENSPIANVDLWGLQAGGLPMPGNEATFVKFDYLQVQNNSNNFYKSATYYNVSAASARQWNAFNSQNEGKGIIVTEYQRNLETDSGRKDHWYAIPDPNSTSVTRNYSSSGTGPQTLNVALPVVGSNGGNMTATLNYNFQTLADDMSVSMNGSLLGQTGNQVGNTNSPLIVGAPIPPTGTAGTGLTITVVPMDPNPVATSLGVNPSLSSVWSLNVSATVTNTNTVYTTQGTTSSRPNSVSGNLVPQN